MTDLFTPTIKDAQVPVEQPWNPDAIVYPAFFGGPLAAAVLGVLNGRKLLLSRMQLMLIAATGTSGLAARLIVSASQGTAAIRLSGAIAGVLIWLVVIALQRKAYRAAMNRGLQAASMVGAGFAAAIGCGVIELILVAVVML